jgi:hypothetical protein
VRAYGFYCTKASIIEHHGRRPIPGGESGNAPSVDAPQHRTESFDDRQTALLQSVDVGTVVESQKRDMKKHTIKVGRLIQVTEGAYSSYATTGWFVCVQEFCPEDELCNYIDAASSEERRRFKNDKFLATVLKKGFLAEVSPFFDEWHLSDYSDADEVKFYPARTERLP